MVKNKNYLNRRKLKTENKLHPWFITGYSDGESSFSIRVRTNQGSRFGFHISIVYSIGAEINPENKKLLDLVKYYFSDLGSINKSGNLYLYEVSSIKELKIIRNHFDTFPLQITKIIYFQLWCKVMDMIENKEHLTKQGFLKILSIKNVFPKGLSIKIRELYPNVELYDKPKFKFNTNPINPYWIAGFVQADGTFGLNITKQRKMTLGYTSQPQFRITQHVRDILVLKKIIQTLKCGNLVKPSINRSEFNISVANLKDLTEIIIPFFENYSLYGAKLLDFNDFCKGIYIIKKKEHLDIKGLNELKRLAYQMNTFRKFKKSF
jgi:LAGLIDADG endonuclease